VDQPALDRQHPPDRRDRLRRGGLPAGGKVEVADRDLEVGHHAEDSVADPAPTISTHVLDTGLGRPAAGVAVTLYRLAEDGRPVRITQALTDGDGRVADLLGRPLQAGDYRLRFDVAERGPFFTAIALDVRVDDPRRSYHVPLLLAPYGLSTHRG